MGNLADVRTALQVGQVVSFVDHCHPNHAEIVPGVTPRWHVIETVPNHERIVAAHLVARRFGMFVPEIEGDIVRRGRKLHFTRLMFTGYVFVFVWDIGSHWDRITGIPGVSSIMCGRDNLGCVTPVVLSDAVIDKIRAVENTKRPLLTISGGEITGQKKKKGRYRRKPRERADIEAEQGGEIVACRAWDAFQDAIATLDSEGRNQTLMTALGLSS